MNFGIFLYTCLLQDFHTPNLRAPIHTLKFMSRAQNKH